jgi:hypothetical protein
MTKQKAQKRKTTLDFLKDHDTREREDFATLAAALAVQQGKVDALAAAIIQINHFTEEMQKLSLVEWKAEVSSDIKWLKYLIGTGAAAGLVSVVVQLGGLLLGK